jgi:hypothetical protein
MYAEVSNLAPDVAQQIKVTLPERLKAGQFQGLFFDLIAYTGDGDKQNARPDLKRCTLPSRAEPGTRPAGGVSHRLMPSSAIRPEADTIVYYCAALWARYVDLSSGGSRHRQNMWRPPGWHHEQAPRKPRKLWRLTCSG